MRLALPYLRTALYGGLNCETPTGRPTLVWSVLLTRMYMSNHGSFLLSSKFARTERVRTVSYFLQAMTFYFFTTPKIIK